MTIKNGDYVSCLGEGRTIFKVVACDENNDCAALINAETFISHGWESVFQLAVLEKSDVKKKFEKRLKMLDKTKTILERAIRSL